MFKLNKKGYLAVEVILASVVAVSIAVFLIDLTVKMVNKTNDNYTNTLFLTDKALITNNLRKEIKQDIIQHSKSNINNIGEIEKATLIDDYSCELKFKNSNVTSNININSTKDTITYSSEYSEYSKTINKDIKYSDIKIKTCTLSEEKNYLIIKINFEDIFTTNNNRDIEIVLYNSTKKLKT